MEFIPIITKIQKRKLAKVTINRLWGLITPSYQAYRIALCRVVGSDWRRAQATHFTAVLRSLSSEPHCITIWPFVQTQMNVDVHKDQRERLERATLTPESGLVFSQRWEPGESKD